MAGPSRSLLMSSLARAIFHVSEDLEPELSLESSGFLGFTGMRHRLSLPENEGMLFDFACEDNHTFWMQDVRIPLDIIFIDVANVIVHIHHNARPMDSSPISAGRLVKAVIEVNGGWCEQNKVVEGVAVSFQGFM